MIDSKYIKGSAKNQEANKDKGADKVSTVLNNAKRAGPEQVVVVPLSGGQDSTTCLFLAQKIMRAEVHAFTIDYGQRHRCEVEAAKRVAAMAGVASHEILRLPGLLKGSSPLVSTLPLARYADVAHLPRGIEDTFVPLRNAVFLALAVNRAVVLGASMVIMGISQEDYGGYPDCREDFLTAMQELILVALGESVEHPPVLYAPLQHLSKRDTVLLSTKIPGCYAFDDELGSIAESPHYGALAYTHTAYDGKYPPQGHDHASLLRAEGFKKAGLPDPLVVRAVDAGMMPLPSTSNYAGKGMKV